jgi:Phosphopantetheine attachment site.
LWTTSGQMRRADSLAAVRAQDDLVLLDYRAPFAPSAVAQLAQAVQAEPRQAAEVEEALMAWVSVVLDLQVEEIDPDVPWADQSVDSLLGAALLAELESLCGAALPDDLLYRHATPADLAAFLAAPGG